MPFILKELIKAGIYVGILTLILYYFVDNKLSTDFIVALTNQVIIFIFDFKRIKNDYKASKKVNL
ncbi:hypothetical protein [Desulfosporosinus sp. FKA]|uniref:hypothetical protein n=1 Tax=Desulfosporosinus sp. FKA TaxID=1969834 RepID=UPI000B49846B|nr:hypothetical protein [Desulfosporosinus sp. FKA]